MNEQETQLKVRDCKTLPALLKHPSIQEKLESTLKGRAHQFASSLISITQGNTALAKADPQTVLAAGMQAALLDLPIQPSLSFAYVVPYKGRAQFQLGYKGLIQLAQRSGKFVALNDVVVRAGQLIEYNELTGELKADFSLTPEEGRNPDGYACYFRLSNGFQKTVFWSYKQVEEHAKRYSQNYRQGKGNSLWDTDFDKMALKTVIKHALSRYAPLSIEMQRAIETDQATVDMDGNVIEYPDNKPDESAFDVAEVSDPEPDDGPEKEPAEEQANLDMEAAEK